MRCCRGAVWRPSTRSDALAAAPRSRETTRAKRSIAACAAASSRATLASRIGIGARARAGGASRSRRRRWRSASTSSCCRFGLSSRSSCRYGIAVDDPDVAQHLEEHPRRAPGAPLAAQLVQHRPQVRAEQPDDDLAVGERRVVVRDLAQARGVASADRPRTGIGRSTAFMILDLPQRSIRPHARSAHSRSTGRARRQLRSQSQPATSAT